MAPLHEESVEPRYRNDTVSPPPGAAAERELTTLSDILGRVVQEIVVSIPRRGTSMSFSHTAER